jgi:hypothetical protein
VNDFKTEEDLVIEFINSLKRTNTSRKRIILREVDCWQGRADVVSTLFKEDVCVSYTLEQLDLLGQYTCSILLSLLHRRANRSLEYLLKKSGVSERTTISWINKLIHAKMIKEASLNKFILHHDFIIPDTKFIAYEVKLHDWKRALFQAIQYKGFSNQSYVVMPEESIKPALKNQIHFISNNIGLISVSKNGSIKTVIKSYSRQSKKKSLTLIAKSIALKEMFYNEVSCLNSLIASSHTLK